MASKPSRTTNFREQEILLCAKLVRDFLEVESKGYDSERWRKRQRHGNEDILTNDGSDHT